MDPEVAAGLIVDAALAVMLRKGIAATTVRDVAAEMGSSPGLVHHYFGSMDELLATAFDQAAGQDLARAPGRRSPPEPDPVAQLRVFFGDLHPGRAGLGVPAVAGRLGRGAPGRPVLQETSQRLNVAWQQLLVESDRGRASRTPVVHLRRPVAVGWRILSMIDGLALQTVAHRVDVDRDSVSPGRRPTPSASWVCPAGSLA